MAYEAEIRARRRRRRAEEHRRRVRYRRRNALLVIVAVVGFFIFRAVSGGGSDNQSAGVGEGQAAAAAAPGDCAGPSADVTAPPATATGEPDPRPVPVLMYHEIGEPPPGASLPELFVTADDFRAQIAWLQSEGYTGITLDQLDGGWSGKGPALPAKPIVVSFDDGYLGQYTDGLPALTEAGFPAVLNLEVNNITKGDLSRTMICEMLAAGWEVAAHSITHPDLTTLAGADLSREVGGSRSKLQDRFGVPVHHFAYPAGSYNADTIAAVKEAGFHGAVTTKPGLASPEARLEQPRIRIDRSDGLDGFISKLQAQEG